MLEIEVLHHVAVPVTDLGRAKEFYSNVLGLKEIARPNFPFPGAWYQAGDRQLHLIVGADPTFRIEKGVNSQDAHWALRVKSFRGALEYLRTKGYREANDDVMRSMRVSPAGAAGFPQIHLMDPDRNVIEINAETLD